MKKYQKRKKERKMKKKERKKKKARKEGRNQGRKEGKKKAMEYGVPQPPNICEEEKYSFCSNFLLGDVCFLERSQKKHCISLSIQFIM